MRSIWSLPCGPPEQPTVVFHYDPSCSKEALLRLMEGFSGYPQTDGYADYSAVCKQEGVSRIGCCTGGHKGPGEAQIQECPERQKESRRASEAPSKRPAFPYDSCLELYRADKV